MDAVLWHAFWGGEFGAHFPTDQGGTVDEVTLFTFAGSTTFASADLARVGDVLVLFGHLSAVSTSA